jgi:hypothetical protein
MNIGIDFHDTISVNPLFFQKMMQGWPGKVYIVTGTPESKREETIQQLEEIGIKPSLHYDSMLMGFEYKKKGMTIDHFQRMKEHKLKLIQEYNIKVYFDDNPFYVDYLRNHGITVFQTVLSDSYLDKFEKRDPFFSCNLQRGQFEYLKQEYDT